MLGFKGIFNYDYYFENNSIEAIAWVLLQGLSDPYEYAIICPQFIQSGRSAVRLARLHGVQEVGGSNPLAPTVFKGSSSSYHFEELVCL